MIAPPAQLSHHRIDIRTSDGTCPTHVFEPRGRGPWPAVIMYMDGMGVRPALFEIAERLAAGGYVVLLPDLYYLSGFTPAEGARIFTDEVVRADWRARILPTVAANVVMRDVPAFLAHLDSLPSV